ncbi:hypothetical protein [Labrys miyagiensis]
MTSLSCRHVEPGRYHAFGLSSYGPKRDPRGSLDLKIHYEIPGCDSEADWFPALASGTLA